MSNHNDNGNETSSEENSKTSRTIWVSGLSHNTKASDLQILFKTHGSVIEAKIVANPRMPGSSCFGLITMKSSEEANNCIGQLNKTEFQGETITVGRVSLINKFT